MPDATADATPAAPISISEPDANPMVTTIQELVESVAQRLEDKLGIIGAIKAAGGPYEASKTLVAERNLREAAASAIETLVMHPAFRPN